MVKKILAILATIGGFFSAVFFVLMKQARTERKLEEAEEKAQAANDRADKVEAMHQAEKAVAESIKEQEAENEKLVERVHSGDNLDSFSAGIDLLRKQSESGSKRNTRTGSTRT